MTTKMTTTCTSHRETLSLRVLPSCATEYYVLLSLQTIQYEPACDRSVSVLKLSPRDVRFPLKHAYPFINADVLPMQRRKCAALPELFVGSQIALAAHVPQDALSQVGVRTALFHQWNPQASLSLPISFSAAVSKPPRAGPLPSIVATSGYFDSGNTDDVSNKRGARADHSQEARQSTNRSCTATPESAPAADGSKALFDDGLLFDAAGNTRDDPDASGDFLRKIFERAFRATLVNDEEDLDVRKLWWKRWNYAANSTKCNTETPGSAS